MVVAGLVFLIVAQHCAVAVCNDNFGVRLTTTEMAGFQVWFRNR